MTQPTKTLDETIRAVDDEVHNRGLTLARCRAALTTLRTKLGVDAAVTLDTIREKRLADAIESSLCDEVHAALAARDTAKTDEELAEAKARLDTAWQKVSHEVGHHWDKVCPPPAKPKPYTQKPISIP